MKELLNDAKSLSEKIIAFSENNLNEKEQQTLDTIFLAYSQAISEKNAPTILGKDPGFLSEIRDAIEKEDEIHAMTTPATTVTVSSRPCIVAATIIVTTIMSGDSPQSCKK